MGIPCDGPSDFELIRQMAEQSVDFAGARRAWAQFYVRHGRLLRLVCNRDYRYLLGEDGVEDLVDETFMRAFDRVASFDHKELCAPPIQELKCQGWLKRIAENLVRDRFRGQREVELVQVDVADLEKLGGSQDDCSSQCEVPEDKRLELLKAGFDLLTGKEQTILLATVFWQLQGRKHQRMPHLAMEQLSKDVGKSPSAIRQMRLRALEKLKKYVNENLPDEKAD